MQYTDLKYCVGKPPFGDGETNTGIICKINGMSSSVPIDKNNTDYLRIMITSNNLIISNDKVLGGCEGAGAPLGQKGAA